MYNWGDQKLEVFLNACVKEEPKSLPPGESCNPACYDRSSSLDSLVPADSMSSLQSNSLLTYCLHASYALRTASDAHVRNESIDLVEIWRACCHGKTNHKTYFLWCLKSRNVKVPNLRYPALALDVINLQTGKDKHHSCILWNHCLKQLTWQCDESWCICAVLPMIALLLQMRVYPCKVYHK